jgi:autotransporter strand-loop-strand O-heptosyltransferase
MKLLIINPHLSTGGCPQYLLKYLECNLKNYTEVKVIEFTNFSSDFVVQKNKIKQLIGENNVICLGEFNVDDETFVKDKMRLLDIVNDYRPDVIWFNEFPESFEYRLPPTELMKKIYSKDRSYKIIETTHNNSFNFTTKIFMPDEFMFCSELHLEKSKFLNVPKSVWEVPIELNERPDRNSKLLELGLDPNYLHVLNVGLFCSNKNQKYIFDLAEKLKPYKIMFHFIGNLCFLNQCGISAHQIHQSNCKIWGERSDVDVFMSCMDVFLFPSIKELNPLSVIEALSWNMSVICKECDNYTYKYKGRDNFYLLNDINVKDFLIQKLKKTQESDRSCAVKKNIKFALYTSFYNASGYIDRIFNKILNLKYDNFTWFITDDFSSDDTKNLILQKLKTIKTDKIKYVEQQFKKQMYWQPNTFIDKTYDYIVTVDFDDDFDLRFLNIYNKYLLEDESISLLTCDFQKKNANDEKLRSLGLVYNNEKLKSKIHKFHPNIDYLNNLNYYAFGCLRCFKNDAFLNFEIKDFDACAEDSYRMMNVGSNGKWLHIPRNLYTWYFRENSESHYGETTKKENFNANFDLAYNKLINSQSLCDFKFLECYKETCALNILDLNFNKSISLFTKTQNTNAIKDLYSDLKFSINDFSEHDCYIFILNYYSESELISLLNNLKNKNAEILFYKLNDLFFENNEGKDAFILKERGDNLNMLSKFANINYWFEYIRHFYAKAKLKPVEICQSPVIDVFDFDLEAFKIDFRLLEGPEDLYNVKIFDNNSNMFLYGTVMNLCKGVNFWISFDFSRDFVQDSVTISFEHEGEVIYEKEITIYENKKGINIFEKDNFNREVEAGSYVEVFTFGQYSKYNIEVEQGDVVVDIGTNVGAFIKLALNNKCKKIYACEPSRDCMYILNKYYGQNDNLTLLNYAISNNSGSSYLLVDPKNRISGSNKLIESQFDLSPSTEKVLVRTKTFKDFIQENKIQKIDFLKVDCEGGEDFIFNDENIEFLKTNVSKIVLEYHNENSANIEKLLKAAGFDVIDEKSHLKNVGFFYAKNKNFNHSINILNESGSLGDVLAWVPIVNEYALQNKIHVNLYTCHKNLFKGQYDSINFCDYVDKVDVEFKFVLGCFGDEWKKYTLQEIASNILGIEYKEVRPKINLPTFEKKPQKKYVCIATQSTAQCKYWNNPSGWTQTVEYLKSLGYDVICIDRYAIFGTESHFNKIPENCIDDTGDKPLEERIKTLLGCDFFIGLGSGLSWLAWACNKPVIMISGFSRPESEFYTPYRVFNENVCNGCWNDPTITFDRKNWLWCPRGKNFECSKEISFEMVKEKIDKYIKNK